MATSFPLECTGCKKKVESEDQAYTVYKCRKGHLWAACKVECLRILEKKCEKCMAIVDKVLHKLNNDGHTSALRRLPPCEREKMKQHAEAANDGHWICPLDVKAADKSAPYCAHVMVHVRGPPVQKETEEAAEDDTPARRQERVSEKSDKLLVDDDQLVLLKDDEFDDMVEEGGKKKKGKKKVDKKKNMVPLDFSYRMSEAVEVVDEPRAAPLGRQPAPNLPRDVTGGSAWTAGRKDLLGESTGATRSLLPRPADHAQRVKQLLELCEGLEESKAIEILESLNWDLENAANAVIEGAMGAADVVPAVAAERPRWGPRAGVEVVTRNVEEPGTVALASGTMPAADVPVVAATSLGAVQPAAATAATAYPAAQTAHGLFQAGGGAAGGGGQALEPATQVAPAQTAYAVASGAATAIAGGYSHGAGATLRTTAAATAAVTTSQVATTAAPAAQQQEQASASVSMPPSQPPPPRVPKEWQAVWDPASKHFYYWHTSTNHVQWNKPVDESEAQRTTQPPAQQPAGVSASTCQPQTQMAHANGTTPAVRVDDMREKTVEQNKFMASGGEAAMFNAQPGFYHKSVPPNTTTWHGPPTEATNPPPTQMPAHPKQGMMQGNGIPHAARAAIHTEEERQRAAFAAAEERARQGQAERAEREQRYEREQREQRERQLTEQRRRAVEEACNITGCTEQAAREALQNNNWSMEAAVRILSQQEDERRKRMQAMAAARAAEEAQLEEQRRAHAAAAAAQPRGVRLNTEYVCTRHFRPRSEVESAIRLVQGERIMVEWTDGNPQGWAFGSLVDRPEERGYFPVDVLSEVREHPRRRQVGERCWVREEFKPLESMAGYLHIKPGDYLEIMHMEEPCVWAYAQKALPNGQALQGNEHAGWVPETSLCDYRPGYHHSAAN